MAKLECMNDFLLEEWEWPLGAERRYIVEPFQSECLGEMGLARITVCLVPCRQATSDDEDNATNENGVTGLVFFRPEQWQLTLRNLWLDLAPDVPAPNYTVCTEGDYEYPLEETLQAFIHRKGSSFFEEKSPFDDDDELESEDDSELSSAQASPLQTAIEEFLVDCFLKSERYRVARYFCLPKGTCFLSETNGQWLQAAPRRHNTPFRVPAGLRFQSSATIYDWLQTQLSQSDSEVRFAYQWNSQDDKQHHQTSLALDPRATLWRNIVRAVVRIETTLHDSRYTWHLYPPSEKYPLRSYLRDRNDYETDKHADLRARLQLWGQLLQKHSPLVEFESSTTPLCFLEEYVIRRAYIIGFRCEVSAHEKMEAALKLRQWARKKATPEEMDLLFPSLNPP